MSQFLTLKWQKLVLRDEMSEAEPQGGEGMGRTCGQVKGEWGNWTDESEEGRQMNGGRGVEGERRSCFWRTKTDGEITTVEKWEPARDTRITGVRLCVLALSRSDPRQDEMHRCSYVVMRVRARPREALIWFIFHVCGVQPAVAWRISAQNGTKLAAESQSIPSSRHWKIYRQ